MQQWVVAEYVPQRSGGIRLRYWQVMNPSDCKLNIQMELKSEIVANVDVKTCIPSWIIDASLKFFPETVGKRVAKHYFIEIA